jgi:ABC-2 type transport system permease protein
MKSSATGSESAATGFLTLLYKELLRVWKISFQTIAAPILTALLYLAVFAYALEGRVRVFDTVPYATFLVPGLAMMSMLQNAFANSSSSFIQSKVTGNLVFVLLPPLSHWEFFGAYVAAAMVRGLVVGLGVVAVTAPLVGLPMAHPQWSLVFALLGTGVLGTLGLVAGIWADKFDQLAGFQNFVIMPFTFLAGVFYSVRSLPELWQKVSHFNPFFYMIDGFRYGFFGASDVNPYVSVSIVAVFLMLLSVGALALLRSGYKIRV